MEAISRYCQLKANFGCRKQICRNWQRLEHRAPQSSHPRRSGGTPPKLGSEGGGRREGHRQESKQAVGDQAEGGVALECREGALTTIGKASRSLQLVEDVLDFEARRRQFQQALRGQGWVGGEE